MKHAQVGCSILLLLTATTSARADFKYTETSQVTGGSLTKMMKFASVFARGDTKKQEQQMMAPTSTTRYVKGGRLRTDNSDGTIQIIDLERRRIISIDTNKKTYAVASFDDIIAAMKQAEQNMQQQMDQSKPQNPGPQNAQVTVTPTIKVIPGTGNRTILDQPTRETNVEMDIQMQATATGADAPPPGQPNNVTATMVMTLDSFVAPSVGGYMEFGEFYRRMAKEVNWMTIAPPVQIDPRVTQGFASLAQNSDALKGFRMLSYVTMSMIAVNADGTPVTAQNTQDQQNQKSAPPPSNTNTSSSGSLNGMAAGAALNKLGGLFGHKKQQDNSSSSGSDSSSSSAGGPPPSDPNALIQITEQVTSYSDSSLDSSLFDVPVNYTIMQVDPAMMMSPGAVRQQQSPQKTPGKN